jgi:surface antigen
MNNRVKFSIVFITVFALNFCSTSPLEKKYPFKIGEAIDSLNGVKVFYNGETDNVTEVNFSSDKYLLGLKYQCVEFVKRYYYEYYKHKMPNVYGNAKDFFKTDLQDGEINTDRDLIQYTNPSSTKPQIGDLIVLSGTETNPYGHVAIISNVFESEIEIIQQNAGPFDPSREKFQLTYSKNKWEIQNKRILGWLRKSS